jgi:hypothetical protein
VHEALPPRTPDARSDPARKFWKMSLNANPIATPPIPSVLMTLAGVKLGNAEAIATSSPRSRIPACTNLSSLELLEFGL